MKTKLHCLFIGLALLADVHSAFAQVTNLGIAAAGQQSLIYWPTSSTTNYILQTTASLSSPNWVTASNAVTVNAVTVTNSAPSGYFRLLVLVSTNPPGMVLIPGGRSRWETISSSISITRPRTTLTSQTPIRRTCLFQRFKWT